MSAHQSCQWFWSDWAGDLAVRRLTPAERGLWFDLITLAALASPIGYVCDDRGNPLSLDEIGRFANCSPAEAGSLIDGIIEKGAGSRDRTGRLFNRRMVRDAELSVKRRRAGSAGGVATTLKYFSNNGVPQHMPQHVPRQTGTRANPNRKSNTSDDAAREASHEEPAAPASGVVTTELAAAMQRKGWVR